jgi:hypothetical protein
MMMIATMMEKIVACTGMLMCEHAEPYCGWGAMAKEGVMILAYIGQTREVLGTDLRAKHQS